VMTINHTLRVLFVCYLLHFGGRIATGRKLVSGTKVPRTPLLSWIKKGLPYGFTMLNANLLFLFLFLSMLCYAMLCYAIL
jgi:hypothetical protein